MGIQTINDPAFARPYLGAEFSKIGLTGLIGFFRALQEGSAIERQFSFVTSAEARQDFVLRPKGLGAEFNDIEFAGFLKGRWFLPERSAWEVLQPR